MRWLSWSFGKWATHSISHCKENISSHRKGGLFCKMGDDAPVKRSVPPWRIIVISFVMGAEEGEKKRSFFCLVLFFCLVFSICKKQFSEPLLDMCFSLKVDSLLPSFSFSSPLIRNLNAYSIYRISREECVCLYTSCSNVECHQSQFWINKKTFLPTSRCPYVCDSTHQCRWNARWQNYFDLRGRR